jgi:hypothetical protein
MTSSVFQLSRLARVPVRCAANEGAENDLGATMSGNERDRWDRRGR